MDLGGHLPELDPTRQWIPPMRGHGEGSADLRCTTAVRERWPGAKTESVGRGRGGERLLWNTEQVSQANGSRAYECSRTHGRSAASSYENLDCSGSTMRSTAGLQSGWYGLSRSRWFGGSLAGSNIGRWRPFYRLQEGRPGVQPERLGPTAPH